MVFGNRWSCTLRWYEHLPSGWRKIGVGSYVNGVQDRIARGSVRGNGQHAHSYQGEASVEGVRGEEEILQILHFGRARHSTIPAIG